VAGSGASLDSGKLPGALAMTFTQKPGTGSLFKNDRKSKDAQPDYKGSLTLPDGSTMQLGGWITQGANGKYLSLKISAALPPRSEPDQ
jgi:hypothetical protein